jgi:hypothetical protein
MGRLDTGIVTPGFQLTGHTTVAYRIDYAWYITKMFQGERRQPMQLQIRGHCANPSVVVVGAWDPYLQAHHELFRRMQNRARDDDWSTLVILLDPNPALFVRGAAHWPLYNDLSWRIRYILDSGIIEAAELND